MEDSGIANAGVLTARATLEDASGHRVLSDSYPILTHWQSIPFDLKTAADEGLKLEEVKTIGLQIESIDPAQKELINVQTDDWMCNGLQQHLFGQRLGIPGSFYVQRDGSRLQVGTVGRFEILFHDRAGIDRPWLEIFQGEKNRRVLGQPHTGLMLLDQDQFDGLSSNLHQAAIVGGEKSQNNATPPQHGWPGTQSQYTAKSVWSSAGGAIIEVKQTVGPFDHLGRASTDITWQFMIYPTGQVYVHTLWRHEAQLPTPVPVTWALSVDRSTVEPHVEQPERLLKNIYPDFLQGAVLPHQMQVGSPVHMLAKVGGGESNLYWWADAGDCRLFGVGLPEKYRAGPLDCVLLVDDAKPLEVAGCFSQYLVGPTLNMQAGVQDKTFPGDFDNDGVVEPYGFQAIRLNNGRAVFDLDPQNRPIYYPAFLISNPIGSPSLEGYRILINIDGQQMADPPRWPDGSYLLQLPWVISRPVHIEIRAIPGK
jgi:hypothetical protein